MSSRLLGSTLRRGLVAVALTGLPWLASPQVGAQPAPDALTRPAVPDGVDGVTFDLGPSPDAAVVADALSLAASLPLTPHAQDGQAAVRIRHLGKGRTLSQDPDADGDDERGDFDPAEQRADDRGTTSEMVAFNARSGQEFLISTSMGHLADLAAAAERTGQSRESGPAEPPRRSPTFVMPGLDPSFGGPARTDSWSNGDDDRYRVYGVNAAVASATYRRLVQMGGGCSGTLIGPRHVVTAGHCLWSRKKKAWSDNFTVAAGRNGTSATASVFVDNDAIPGGQVLWYFTPSAFRDPGNSNTKPVDFGVLVLPARLGNTTGWFGWWTLTSTTLGQNTVRRAGYPKCSATSGGLPRLDPPDPCDPNHLYANDAPCELGEFANQKDNWSRTFNHSCDASAADSGSALYLNYQGQGNGVIGVHTTSLCGVTDEDDVCAGDQIDRPLLATRITPEYSGWIGYFRNEFP